MIESSYKCLVTIPIYNHGSTIEKVSEEILKKGYPLLIVDDGCDMKTAKQLISFSERNENVHVLRHPQNLGKGSAFFTALDYAYLNNYTHTFLVDADGQHDLDDLKVFEKQLKEKNDVAVFGNPIFDDSAPLARVLGHKLTNFFIDIESGASTISDALCGFRLYPVKASYDLMKRGSIGRRMEFDPEIAVKLAWKGVEIINHETRVIYTEGGISNFRVLSDNVRISWMHTRLVAQSLWKRILGQPLCYESEHWTNREEKGNSWSLVFMGLLLKYGGRHIAKFLLFFIITYYFIVAKKSRIASRQFFERVYRHKEKSIEEITWLDTWKHLFEFGVCCLDRAICWSGQTEHFKIKFNNYEEVYQRSLEGKGAILLGAHLGNIDVLRAYSKQKHRVKINVLMVNSQSKSFQSIIKKLNKESDIEIIPIEDIQLTTSMLIQSKVEKGELIALLGDRVILHEGGGIEPVSFLGEEALFPNGPYVLSYLLDCPIYSIFSVRKSPSNYEVFIEKLTESLHTDRLNRKEKIKEAMLEYVKRLENITIEYPHQWFNFYNFWSKKP